MIPIEALERNPNAKSGPMPGRLAVWFAVGFRPFFLLAALWSIAAMAVWLLALETAWLPTYRLGVVGWHAYEMLFGYTAAVIAGFTLTAAQVWTGRITATGGPLAILCLLWLGGRIGPFVVPAELQALPLTLDVLFCFGLAFVLARPIVLAKNWRNLKVVGIVAGLALAAAVVHLGDPLWRFATLEAALYLIALLMVVIGGRVIPFFTGRALPGFTPRRLGPVDRAAEPAVLLAIVALLLDAPAALAGGLGLLAAGILVARLAAWHTRELWRVPLLWVLWLGYGWVALGFALAGLAELTGAVPRAAAVHALTAGGIGTLTLGMMSRVALGHTGRPLQPPRRTVVAFAAVLASATVRVVGTFLPETLYTPTLYASGGLWILAFALFTWTYAPILLAPRADGKLG